MRRSTLALLLLTGSGPAAYGSSTVFVAFTNLNNDVQGNGTTNSQSNTYNGETGATIAGIPNELLVCDDFNQSTSVPSGAIDFSTNTISTITSSNVHFTSGTLPGGTVGAVSQTVAYETVAVLVSELEALTPNGANTQAITDYQFAIWYLMEPSGSDGNNSAIKDYPLDTNAAAYLNTAYNDVTNTGATNMTQVVVALDENALVIYTPTSGYASNQEFVGLNTPITTPEPSTWFLTAALGLLVCAPRVRSRVRNGVSRG